MRATGRRARYWRAANEPWHVDDILDVWFDPGSTTPSCWKIRSIFKPSVRRAGRGQRHRDVSRRPTSTGWFQSRC